ncbi:MAG: rod shape-determining protein MreD, partial [Rectinema sp.]|nr:rod shape-determining protein MreD [Rectinema sp.]
MKSVIVTVIAAVLMLFIQSTWLSRGILLGVIPDLCLSVLLFAAFLNKEGQGMFVAFIVGLVADMLSASPLGYHAFLYSVVAYLTTMVSRVAEKDVLVIPFALGAAGTVLKGLLSVVAAALFPSIAISSRILSVEFA